MLNQCCQIVVKECEAGFLGDIFGQKTPNHQDHGSINDKEDVIQMHSTVQIQTYVQSNMTCYYRVHAIVTFIYI